MAKTLDPLNLPKLELKASISERILELCSLVGMLLMWGMLYHAWPDLPAQVPSHFGASGKPDAWGGKNIIFLLPSMATILYGILSVVKNYPHTYNYPYEITEVSVEAQYKNARSMIAWLKTVIILVFLYTTWKSILVSKHQAMGLGMWFLPIFLGTLLGAIAFHLYRGRKMR